MLLDSFGAAEVMRIGDIPIPEPAPDQVLIRVAATSVNRPDIIQRRGHYPPPPGDSDVLGLECAGTVAEIGSEVEGFAKGDRVFALLGGGGYAEFAVAHAGHVLAMPPDMSFEQAACIAETYITAWLNLWRVAELADGENVLLHGGGGGVANAAIQLLRILSPASSVLVTASKGKLERVKALGPHLVIDYGEQDFVDATRRATDDRGADVILDHIGADYFERNLRSLAVNGRLVIIGVMQGSEATLNLARIMLKRQRIIGSVLRPRPKLEKARIVANFASAVMKHFAAGRIAPIIDHVFSIDDVVAAHQRMESREHFGKIVLLTQPG